MSDTYSVKVAYNGEPFSGFARQPGQSTVQGEIEHALELIFRMPIETVCAGRTDSGVHARGQVVSFDVPEDAFEGRTLRSITRSLNALTTDGIVVSDFQQRPSGFSARFDASMREYRYFIYSGSVPPIFMDRFAWHISSEDGLDVEAMREGAKHLIGEHDFKSFCMAASAEGKRTFRNVSKIDFFEEANMGERVLVVQIEGNAFLHSMVRAIVGTLVAVGRGKRSPEWVADVLAACDRRAAGENAPAKGLVLWDVRY